MTIITAGGGFTREQALILRELSVAHSIFIINDDGELAHALHGQAIFSRCPDGLLYLRSHLIAMRAGWHADLLARYPTAAGLPPAELPEEKKFRFNSPDVIQAYRTQGIEIRPAVGLSRSRLERAALKSILGLETMPPAGLAGLLAAKNKEQTGGWKPAS